MTPLVYLHGFASAPSSEKARCYGPRLAALGFDVRIPDLNQPDFSGLTLSRNLRHTERALGDGPGVLVGSSLGGYTAALFAHLHPERVRALVLMAPALNMVSLLHRRYGTEAIESWRQRGSVPVEHPYLPGPATLSYAFLEDAQRWARLRPRPRCPTLVLHGRHDAEVPIEGSRRLAAELPHIELVTFEAGHALTEVLEPVWERIAAFLAPFASPPAERERH
ncbi:MAG: alpha/beta fold hydrolase [Deltaproteobacteria bacterium]|nr:MAG: alpha/beta fold hydrolase [Deltaproteobacteria bacterium]